MSFRQTDGTLRAMKSASIAILFVLMLLSGAPAWAGDAEITIITRDGQTIHGRLVTETDRGFLVALPGETVLVPYERVKDVDRSGASAPASTSTTAETKTNAAPHTDLGFGGGVMYGPTIAERDVGRQFVTGFGLQLPIEPASSARVGVRFTPMLTVGFVGGVSGVWRRYGALTLDVQARFHVTPSFSFGLGGFLGFGVSSSGVAGESGAGAYGAVGPSLTLADFRFGQARQHEIQLWTGVDIEFGHDSSGVNLVTPMLSYVFHF